MGRLENIIARSQRGNRPREPVVVSIFFGIVVLLILGLMVFTDLGRSPDPQPAPHTPGRADGILLRQVPRPAH